MAKKPFIFEKGLEVNDTPVVDSDGYWIGSTSGLTGSTSGSTSGSGSSGY